MDATTERRAAGSATDREETRVRTRSVGRAAPGGKALPAGKAPAGSGSGAPDSEIFLVSAGSLVRPRKPLRAAPRCTVVGVSGSILSRTDDRPGDVLPSHLPVRTGAVSPSAAEAAVAERASPKRSADARLYRGLDAVVAFGGAALLGALTAFMIGERLLWSGTPVPPASAEPEATSSAVQPGADRSGTVRPDAARQPRVDFVNAFAFTPAPSETEAALRPPWRDRAVMPPNASQTTPDASPATSEELAALVRDNLRLDAEVVALETETTELQETLLDRELRLFSAGLPLEGEFGETAAFDSADDFADVPILSDEDGDSGTLELFASEMTNRSRDVSAEEDRAIASATLGAPLQRFVVADVPPGSTAESVGLVPGDILLEIDDIEVIGIEDLIAAEDGNVEGRLHELTVVREGARFPLAYAGNIGSLSLRLDWVDPVFAEW